MTGKPTPKKPAAKADDAKDRRLAEEKHIYDPKHVPDEHLARIDGSGARFESDG